MVIACAVVGAGGAAARPLVHEHYRGTDEFSFDDCGFPIDAVGTFSGLFILKDGRGGDPTPYVLNNYDASTVYTNSDTGAWFTISGNGLYKDMRLTQVAGTVYRLDAMEAGRPFRVQDSDGNQVMVDRGRLLYTALLDTQGDADLSNDTFIEGTFEVLAGFRPAAKSVELMRALAVSDLDPFVNLLAGQPEADGLRALFTTWITAPQPDLDLLVPAVIDCAIDYVRSGEKEFAAEARTVLELGERYPGDAGVLASLLLNRLTLRPGEGIYLPAGNLHTYLHGVGIGRDLNLPGI